MPARLRIIPNAHKDRVARTQFQEMVERMSMPAHVYKFRNSFGRLGDMQGQRDAVFRNDVLAIQRQLAIGAIGKEAADATYCRALDASIKRGLARKK